MKKNLVIIVLSIIVIFLFGAYQNACKERQELNDEYEYIVEQTYKYGQLLYEHLDNGSELTHIVANTRSICDKHMNCVHVDIDGSLWATGK